jgi:hypothetical protein
MFDRVVVDLVSNGSMKRKISDDTRWCRRRMLYSNKGEQATFKTEIIKWFLPGTVCTGSSYGYFAQRGGAWDAR